MPHVPKAELKDHPDDVVLRTGLIARYYNQAFEAEAAAAQQHRSEHI